MSRTQSHDPLPAEGAAGSPVPPTDDGPAVASHLTRTLTMFGGSSVVVGRALSGPSAGPTLRAFGRQTAAWGAINLAIAAVGAARARSHPAEATRLRRTLLINAGLDVGYVAAGAHVAHHRSSFGGRVSPEAARGHGLAVVTQGLGLMALDLYYARTLSPSEAAG
jgi:hypothetical protein